MAPVAESLLDDNKELFFPLNEYRQRLTSVRTEMRKRGLGVLLVYTPENVLYLSGYQTPGYYMYQCLIVTLEHDPVLLIRNGEVGNARTYSWLENCLTYYDQENPVDATLAGMSQLGITTSHVGLEMKSWFLTASAYQELLRREPTLQWSDASGTVEACRLIKSSQEIEYIKNAARAAEAGMRAALDAVAPGRSDNDVSAALHSAMIAAGSEYVAMGPFVAAGKRATIMHGIWGRHTLEQGQTINLEIGASFHRYTGALMRSISIGHPSSDTEKIADAVESANRKLIENVKPGAMTRDLHLIVSDELSTHGYGGARKGRRCGYSLGLAFPPDWGEGHMLSIIDEPNLPLKAGMVLHLPLSVRLYPTSAAAFSETVAVTESGHEVLTNFERRLFRCLV